MMLTELDSYNAILYATQHLKKARFDKYKTSHGHIFNHVTETKRLATHTDFYVPQSLAHNCFVYTFEFDQVGCNKIACFPYKEKGGLCTEKDDTTQVTRFGGSYTFSCQPACRHLYRNDVSLDTKFKNNQCIGVNHILKYYAINPNSRNNDYTLDIEENENKLVLNEHYCLGHGLAWDAQNKKCYTTTAQDVGEFFVGSTIYRYLNAIQAPPLPPLPVTPALPQEWSSLTDWLDGKKPFTEPNVEFPPDENSHALEIVKEIAKEISIDLGISISASKVAHILNKKIPVYLAKGKNAATLATLVKNSIGFAAKTVGKILGAAAIVYEFIGYFTLILDILDPCEFGKVLTKEQLEKFSVMCQEEFRNAFNLSKKDSELIVTPEFIIKLLERNKVETKQTIDFVDARIEEYIAALDSNSSGQRLVIQRENLQTILSKFQRDVNWPYIIYLSITSVFLMLCFISWLLPYMVVLYIYYTISYSMIYR